VTVHAQGEFYGRAEVIQTLAAHLSAVVQDGRGGIIAVRGRRQVGKSTAVERFVQDARVPYVFTAGTLGAATRTQVDDATRAFAESPLPLPGTAALQGASLPGWREWLRVVEQAALAGPVIVVLDEFPWAVEADPSLEGILQNAWDRRLEKLPVLLILIGSDVTMMDSLSEYGRPLFGRVRPLVVDPLNPAEVAQALPAASATGVFDAHLVTGGYPRLVSDLARSGRNAVGYVREAVQDLYSPLVSTARFTLDAEFPESQAAARVLAAIGADDTTTPRFNDLVPADVDATERTRLQTATTRALRVLTEEKRLVESDVPAWAPDKGRLRRYRVTDPYLRFWFRYIGHDVERISRGRADLVVARFERDWSSWRGRSIEPVVRAARRVNDAGGTAPAPAHPPRGGARAPPRAAPTPHPPPPRPPGPPAGGGGGARGWR
jgi:AAA+ ATPase superfamily predicted ATPase